MPPPSVDGMYQSYPLQKKFHSDDFLRTIPHLRSRTPFNSLLLRLRSSATARLTTFFAEREFVQVHPPVISSSDCEGAGEVFSVKAKPWAADGKDKDGPKEFFGESKYLTVSSQLHLEALAQSVGRVWALAPTFRAERGVTARHLSEFYMLEVEMNFAHQLEGVMDLLEEMIQDLVRPLTESRLGAELLQARRHSLSDEESKSPALSSEALQHRWDGLLSQTWPRVSYTRAVTRLCEAVAKGEAQFMHPPSWGCSLQAEHERFIAQVFGRGGKQPVFVTDFPRDIKPFYMAPSSTTTDASTTTPSSSSSAEDSSDADAVDAPAGPTVACFDLLFPDMGEVAGGSLREHRLDELLRAMQRQGLVTPTAGDPPAPPLGRLNWYVDLRRWGSVPHGGFGLGFDRLLCYLTGVPNIKEMVTFPRWAGRCDC